MASSKSGELPLLPSLPTLNPKLLLHASYKALVRLLTFLPVWDGLLCIFSGTSKASSSTTPAPSTPSASSPSPSPSLERSLSPTRWTARPSFTRSTARHLLRRTSPSSSTSPTGTARTSRQPTTSLRSAGRRGPSRSTLTRRCLRLRELEERSGFERRRLRVRRERLSESC